MTRPQDPQDRLLNAAYRVATEPTPTAYGGRYSIQHNISRPALRELLEVLAELLPGPGSGDRVRHRIAAMDRGDKLSRSPLR